MFPDMEEDVIEAILRANNGVVDTTIDQLLQINNETQEKKKRNKAAAAINNEQVMYSFVFIKFFTFFWSNQSINQ